MKIVLMFLLLTVYSSSAQSHLKETYESLNSCRGIFQSEDGFLFRRKGFYLKNLKWPREKTTGALELIPLDNSAAVEAFETDDGVVDAKVFGEFVYILTYTSIEKWHRRQKVKVAEYQVPVPNVVKTYRMHARGFHYFNNRFYIAQGRMGLTVFNIATESFERQIPLVQQGPLESQAMGIAAKGEQAIIVMDSFSLVKEGEKPPLRGFVFFDMKRQKVTKVTGGMDPAAETVEVLGDEVFVRFHPPVHRFRWSQLLSDQKVAIDKIIWPSTREQPRRHVFTTDKDFYLCEGVLDKGRIIYERPLVLPRSGFSEHF